jgi:hypothetical protein
MFTECPACLGFFGLLIVILSGGKIKLRSSSVLKFLYTRTSSLLSDIPLSTMLSNMFSLRENVRKIEFHTIRKEHFIHFQDLMFSDGRQENN